MGKLKLALALTATMVALIIVSIFTLPSFIDWRSNKGFIENIASDYFGHRVKINGDLQVQLLPNPKIYAEKVILDSVSGGEKIVEIEQVVLTKKLSDLLMFDLSVDQVVVNRPKVTFIQDISGSRNWEPLKVKNSNYYSRKSKKLLDNLTNFKKIVIENANISYKDELTEEENVVNKIFLTFENEEEEVSAAGSAVYNEIEQKVSVRIGTSAKNSLKIHTKLSNQDYMLLLQGIVSNPYNIKKAQFVGKVNAEFENGNKFKINKTLSDFAEKHFDLNELSISADITASDNNINMSKIDLNSKHNKLKGSFSYKQSSEITDIDLKLEIDKILVKRKEYVARHDDLEWSDTPLDFAFANNLRINSSISCTECSYGDKTFYQINVKATLENNNFIINQFSLKPNNNGYIKFSGTAGLSAPYSFETKFDIHQFPFSDLTNNKYKDRLDFQINGGASFAASGLTAKSLAGNLAGSLELNLLNIDLTRLDDSSVSGLVDGLVFNRNRVSYNSRASDIRLTANIRDGVMRTPETSFYLAGEEAIAKGKFDLANLTVNYRVEPTMLSRDNLGIVLSGNVNDLDIISDKITPKGVIDGFNRLVTTEIVKKVKRKKVATPFDFGDRTNLEENLKKYLFEN